MPTLCHSPSHQVAKRHTCDSKTEQPCLRVDIAHLQRERSVLFICMSVCAHRHCHPPITNQYEGKGAIRQFNPSVTRMNQLRHCIVFIASVAPYRDASSTYGCAFMRTRFSAYECHLRCMSSYQFGPVSCPFRGWMSMQRSNVPQDDVANDSPSQRIWPSSTIPSASN